MGIKRDMILASSGAFETFITDKQYMNKEQQTRRNYEQKLKVYLTKLDKQIKRSNENTNNRGAKS
jgi:hypothetical protein